MEKFVIEGGHRLKGDITPSGNKNEALPALSAALLSAEPVTLHNVPNIKDVGVMLEIIEALGARVERPTPNTVIIEACDIERRRLDEALCQRIRASILFAGPLVARLHGVDLPPPGGDVIGRRRLDTHFVGLRELGATFELDRVYRLRSAGRLRGASIFLDEQSVTATENLVMAAVLADGKTVLQNAACEPHVQGLCRMLIQMGAHIEGVGTNTLTIDGVEKLRGTEYTIGPDYLEIGSFIGLGAVIGDGIRIHGVRQNDMRMIYKVFERLGVTMERSDDQVFVPGGQQLRIQADLHGAIPKIDDAPWPAFPTDLMSIVITVATQAQGTVLFFEKMFDGRMFFVDNLIGMGASIILCDPHRVVVAGPSQLFGSTVESPDVRAGMALLIASLCAKGQSTVYNIRQIDRGYERIDDKLRAMGAAIERVEV